MEEEYIEMYQKADRYRSLIIFFATMGLSQESLAKSIPAEDKGAFILACTQYASLFNPMFP